MHDDNTYEFGSNEHETVTGQRDWMDEALVLLISQEREKISEIYATLECELSMAAVRLNRIDWKGGTTVQRAKLVSVRHWYGTRLHLAHRTLRAFALGTTQIRSSENAPIGFNGAGQTGELAGIFLTQDGQLYDENRWFMHKSCSYHGLQDVRSYSIDKALALTEAARNIP